jgi:hypothetical protein
MDEDRGFIAIYVFEGAMRSFGCSRVSVTLDEPS